MNLQEHILYAIAKRRLEKLRTLGRLRYARAWYLSPGEYADSQTEAHAETRDLFFATCDFSNKTILDVGCGNGNGLPDLCRKARFVWALDYDLSDIERCDVYLKKAGCHNYSLLVGDAAELPVPSASVDIVTMQDSFEHFTQYEQAYFEALRVLKPDGFLFLITWFLQSPGHSHLTDLVKMAHVDVFFSKKAILRVYARLAREEEAHICQDDLARWRTLTGWHMEQFRGFLNFISLREFWRMVLRHPPVSVVLCHKEWQRTRVAFVCRFVPFLRTFFLKSVTIGLQKRAAGHCCGFPSRWSDLQAAIGDLRAALWRRLQSRRLA